MNENTLLHSADVEAYQPVSSFELEETVIGGGYCVGCGGCAAVEGSPLRMSWQEAGVYVPERAHDTDVNSERLVCPFSQHANLETKLAAELFPAALNHEKIGRYIATYAGWSNEGERQAGSSGGIGSWLLKELFANGVVDCVAHVKPKIPSADSPALFSYQVSTSVAEIEAGAKSHYYPAEVSQIISRMRRAPGRYAVVAVPCVAKALRMIAAQDPVIAERLAVIVGIVCGHMKSAAFAESLAWEAGIEPSRLVAFDFRTKRPDGKASEYGFTAKSTERSITLPMADARSRDWGMGWFRLKACDYCDDVLAEVADVVIGDAWLPQYVDEPSGTNVVVVRNPTIRNIFVRARTQGRIYLDALSPDEVANSQRAGLFHRREGLSYRLWLRERERVWTPRKRVSAGAAQVSKRQRKILNVRQALSAASHKFYLAARKNNDIHIFIRGMEPLVKQYRRAYSPFLTRVVSKLKRLIKNVMLITGVKL